MLAFLHLSLGRQKATSGSFLTDGFGWLGLNPVRVFLFRMPRPLHVLEALKFNPTEAEAATEATIPSPSTTWFCMFLERFRSCLSSDVRQLHWPFFIFL